MNTCKQSKARSSSLARSSIHGFYLALPNVEYCIPRWLYLSWVLRLNVYSGFRQTRICLMQQKRLNMNIYAHMNIYAVKGVTEQHLLLEHIYIYMSTKYQVEFNCLHQVPMELHCNYSFHEFGEFQTVAYADKIRILSAYILTYANKERPIAHVCPQYPHVGIALQCKEQQRIAKTSSHFIKGCNSIVCNTMHIHKNLNRKQNR